MSSTPVLAMHQHQCAGCKSPIAGKHLRVNFSPPDQPWRALRFHDLAHLIDFLQDEEDAAGEGVLFSDYSWVDATTSVPVKVASGT